MDSNPNSPSKLRPSFESLRAQCNAGKSWECLLPFQEAYCSGDEPSSVSLVGLMKNRVHDYVFPDCYDGIESEDRLVMEIKLAALLEGFVLVIASRKTSEQLGRAVNETNRQMVLRLECEHHRVRRESDRQTARQVSSKKQSNKEDSCPFRLIIYLHKVDGSPSSNRWFLARLPSTKCSTAGCHNGHFQLDPEDLRISTSLMTTDNKELAKQCAQLHFSSSHTAALVAVRDELGLAWDAKQIAYLTRKERRQQSVLSSHASSADELIASFNKRTDVSYCMISYDRCDGLVLLQKHSRKKLSLPSIEEAADLHRQCGFNDHERLLLIFLFASDEEFRLLSMHPEILAVDTTFGVERSKRGLFTIAGVDGNNNAFNCGRAFIPNEQSWVFKLLFDHVLPNFWGRVIATRVRRFITDGCPQEYGAIILSTDGRKKFSQRSPQSLFLPFGCPKMADQIPHQQRRGRSRTA
jgi:MULE transposase domain